MYKLFLTLRYLRKRRIAIFAVVSVWLCVAMEVIVISVMGGFLDTLKERSRGLLSDIVIDNQTLQGFPLYEDFVEHLNHRHPGLIAAWAPVIYNYGILRVDVTKYTKPVRVVGIRLDQYIDVNDFGNSLYYNKYYPGTTTLDYQFPPSGGYDQNDLPILPPDHEAAFEKWRQSAEDPEEIQNYKRDPLARFPGPGEFIFYTDAPPGYYGEDSDKSPGVIVGSNIINERDKTGEFVRIYPRGSKIILTLLPLSHEGNIDAAGAVTAVTRLADDSRTRVFEIDDICCYVDFDLLQKWLGMGPRELEVGGTTRPRASQLLIRLADGQDARETRALFADEWAQFLRNPPGPLSTSDFNLLSMVKVETWEERQVQFIAAVEKEKILVTILFGVISLVAVVLIGCIFWMIVTQKTRDIGTIKSFGASAKGVAMIFVGFGIAVGVCGAILGSVSGALFVHYINDIQTLLEQIHPQLRVWSPDIYTFDTIPSHVKWNELLVIGAIAIGASVVGALIPAILAGRVWPVQSLRYE